MRVYTRAASAILAFVVAVVGLFYWIATERAEARQNELRSFLQGALAAHTTDRQPVRVRALDLPGTPIAVCTVHDYEGLDDLRAFLGPQRFDDFQGAYRMDNHKGAVIAVFDQRVVVVEPFSTNRTECFNATNLSLVINGRRIELQAD